MVKKWYLKLSRTSKNRHSALGPTEEVQFDSEHKPCSIYVTPVGKQIKSDKRHLITINFMNIN